MNIMRANIQIKKYENNIKEEIDIVESDEDYYII